MTDAEKYFADLTGEVPGVKPGKMFGSLCMKTRSGKSAAMFWKDCIVVKLNSNLMEEALNLQGTKLFEPMEGRAMKEWVQIPFNHRDKWKMFALASLEYVNK